MLHYRGIARLVERITQLMTGFLGNNMTYEKETTDSKIINIAHCKTYKKRLLAAECMILIRHCHQPEKTRALYESTDGPAGQPTVN
jgi:hypothetical protein